MTKFRQKAMIAGLGAVLFCVMLGVEVHQSDWFQARIRIAHYREALSASDYGVQLACVANIGALDRQPLPRDVVVLVTHFTDTNIRYLRCHPGGRIDEANALREDALYGCLGVLEDNIWACDIYVDCIVSAVVCGNDYVKLLASNLLVKIGATALPAIDMELRVYCNDSSQTASLMDVRRRIVERAGNNRDD